MKKIYLKALTLSTYHIIHFHVSGFYLCFMNESVENS
ncbi:MAG: hypothetical protein H6Q14_2085 [Bacteroidetes bacterium]|nr:hypothetical protein [Bacteroidota bacterium]